MPRAKRADKRPPSPGLAKVAEALKKSRGAVISKAKKCAAKGNGQAAKENCASSMSPDYPVDFKCPLFGKASIFCDPKTGKQWSCMLNQTNLAFNNNKFYLIQLARDEGGKFHVWYRWGRVGFNGQVKLEGYGNELEKAKAAFEKKFYDKTVNHWSDSDKFVKHDRKYELLAMDYEVSTEGSKAEKIGPQNTSDESDGVASKKRKKEVKDIVSKLDGRIQDLIGMICDVESMKETMLEMKFDTNKAPLGKLTEAQIKAGYSALSSIVDCLSGDGGRDALVKACSAYYTRIPHCFGMRTPPLIQSSQDIRRELELLESLADIEVIVRLFDKLENLDTLHPLDQKYKSLKCDLRPLEREDEIFIKIERYVSTTHARTHSMYVMKVRNVFGMRREGEDERFIDRGNRMLLWHGSRMSNWAGILYKGLKIAPAEAPSTGFMFGKGIYFADICSKSANYCYANRKNNIGLIVLSEVSLGKPREMKSADYEADRLPKGKHSVIGKGKFRSDNSQWETLDDGTVIPYGPIDYDKDGHCTDLDLNYNEFVVYDEKQVKMKYLVEIEFEFK